MFSHKFIYQHLPHVAGESPEFTKTPGGTVSNENVERAGREIIQGKLKKLPEEQIITSKKINELDAQQPEGKKIKDYLRAIPDYEGYDNETNVARKTFEGVLREHIRFDGRSWGAQETERRANLALKGDYGSEDQLQHRDGLGDTILDLEEIIESKIISPRFPEIVGVYNELKELYPMLTDIELGMLAGKMQLVRTTIAPHDSLYDHGHRKIQKYILYVKKQMKDFPEAAKIIAAQTSSKDEQKALREDWLAQILQPDQYFGFSDIPHIMVIKSFVIQSHPDRHQVANDIDIVNRALFFLRNDDIQEEIQAGNPDMMRKVEEVKKVAIKITLEAAKTYARENNYSERAQMEHGILLEENLKWAFKEIDPRFESDMHLL